MNRRRIAFLAPLIAVLAMLLGLTESASAAFNPAAQNPHYGNFLLWESEASASEWLQLADPTKEIGEWIYDSALGVPVYVRQNPWTKFDPLGLASEHETKWQGVAADESRNVFSRIGAAFMATGEALNPFRSDSSIRQGGRDLQVGLAEGREELKKAPPGIRELGQATLGVGSLGTSVLTIPAGMGEIGDSYQQVGGLQTAKNIATGFVEHIKENPVEGITEVGVGMLTANAMLGSTARTTLTTSDGFLGRGFNVKAPFDIPAQRFGSMSLGKPDFWGAKIGTGEFVNRTFAAIKPSWNDLTQYTSGTIPKGTPMKVGLIGPQGPTMPGLSLQFVTESRKVINQTSKIIPRDNT